MPRVILITTGKAEHKSFAFALGRLFPDVTFENDGPMPADSFTSCRVTPPPPNRTIEANVDKLAARLVAAVDPGRKTKSELRADLAIAVEDLELDNFDQPQMVVDIFREAVRRHVERAWPSARRRDECFDKLKERGSFHLLVPMLEAYFFGEPGALRRAGTTETPQLAAGIDLEAFEIVDAAYLVLQPDDARHPKRYLSHLCQRNGVSYREARHGAAASRDLDWNSVLAPADQVQCLRALIHDLADGLGVSPPVGGSCSPITFRLHHPSNVLRNL